MFKILNILLLVLLVNNQIFAQSNTLVSSGMEKLQKKNYKEALNDFNSVLKDNPTNLKALCGSAMAQSNLDNTDEALKISESALKINPQSDIANYTKGEILLTRKDYNGAIALFNKAIEINKSHFQSYVGKSKAYNLLGDTKEAYRILDNAIQEFPSSSELFLARGILNNNKEKYSKALLDFDNALKLNNTNSFGIYFNRGIAYSSLEEYDSALADFTKASELEPTNANAFYSRGLANYQLSNYEASVKDFIRADELNPNNAVTYYNLGMTYYKLEDIENACLYFHKACAMKNTNACKMIIMVCSDKQVK